MKLELVPISVSDVDRAKALVGRGVDVGEVVDVGRGIRNASFEDPDGNRLTLQEMPWRTGAAFWVSDEGSPPPLAAWGRIRGSTGDHAQRLQSL